MNVIYRIINLIIFLIQMMSCDIKEDSNLIEKLNVICEDYIDLLL